MSPRLDMPNEESASTNATALEFGHVTPILRVSNLEASLDYYIRALGFALEWRNRQFGSVRRGKASLMLCEGDQGHFGTWVWLAVGDADAAPEELRTRGAAIRHPPSNYPWGSRELQSLRSGWARAAAGIRPVAAGIRWGVAGR